MPMQWSVEKNAGFTTGESWLPIAADYPEINVESERENPRSLLVLYRRLIELRRGESALELGSFEPVKPGVTFSPIFGARRATGARISSRSI
jgi:alpha-glucosidase